MVIGSPIPTSDEVLIRLRNPQWIQLVRSSAEDEAAGLFQSGVRESVEEAEDEDDEGEEEDEENEEEEETKQEKKKTNGEKKEEKKTKEEAEENEQERMEEEEEDEGDEGDEDEGDDEEERILVFHCLMNQREHHMDGQYMQEGADPACLRVPISCEPALVYLVAKYPEFVPLASLPEIPEKSRLDLAVALWSEGLLETKTA